MSILLGLVIVYVIPALVAGLFWFGPVLRITRIWEGRDVMEQFIPNPKHVSHSEKILRVRP